MISLLPGGGDVGPNVGTKPNCGGCGGWMVPAVPGTCGMWAHWALLLPVSMAATLTGERHNNTQTLAPEWAHDSVMIVMWQWPDLSSRAALHPRTTLVSRCMAWGHNTCKERGSKPAKGYVTIGKQVHLIWCWKFFAFALVYCYPVPISFDVYKRSNLQWSMIEGFHSSIVWFIWILH